jgi:23S rRNA pseudouridine1911/1915/1917 synthase
VAWADWRLLARGQGATLVEVRLGTGRRNQIRVHAAWRGHPLVGERLYLPPGHAPGVGAARQCLHAAELAVRTPDGREGRWTAPLPRDFAAVLRGVGISASA